MPWLTVEENLNLVRPADQVLTSIPQELEEPIRHLMHRPAFELSFGQRRLVELCRALENPPDLLCLDEPFNFLDTSARAVVAGWIRLTAGRNTQVVLSTHNVEDFTLLDAPVFRFPESRPLASLVKG